MEDFWILIIFSNTQYDVSGSEPLDNNIGVTEYLRRNWSSEVKCKKPEAVKAQPKRFSNFFLFPVFYLISPWYYQVLVYETDVACP